MQAHTEIKTYNYEDVEKGKFVEYMDSAEYGLDKIEATYHASGYKEVVRILNDLKTRAGKELSAEKLLKLEADLVEYSKRVEEQASKQLKRSLTYPGFYNESASATQERSPLVSPTSASSLLEDVELVSPSPKSLAGSDEKPTGGQGGALVGSAAVTASPAATTDLRAIDDSDDDESDKAGCCPWLKRFSR